MKPELSHLYQLAQNKRVLDQFRSQLNVAEIEAEAERRHHEQLLRPHWNEARRLFSVAEKEIDVDLSVIDLGAPEIAIGAESDCSAGQLEIVAALIRSLIPWRKGPFSLFGESIDAEWRSDKKWDRIAPFLGDLERKRILDVGCNNGYYLLRMLEHQPSIVFGMDPAERCLFQFELLQRFLRNDRLYFDLFGIEDLHLFKDFFDVALCLGVVYHQRSPFDALQKLKQSLRVGGVALCESITIDGDESVALFTPGRYAKMRNVYFVPTPTCLASWMIRAGFDDVEIVSEAETTGDEQRSTDLAPYESLEHFIDPEDPAKTTEGYPAPRRTCIRGVRRS